MRRRYWILTLIFLFVLLILPGTTLAYDYNGVTYNDNDFTKLQTFLNQPSAVAGKTNGQQLNADYDQNDPTTWSGVSWFLSEGIRYVCQLNWTNKSLSGDLSLDNCIKLEIINCSANQLTAITATNNPKLKTINCAGNQLISLNIENNDSLTDLSCYHNQLTTLDCSKNTSLINVLCGSNKLTSLNINGCVSLLNLECCSNLLCSLDLTTNTALKNLNCNCNTLTSLDVSTNTTLTNLRLNYNQLTSLNVSKNNALVVLHCGSNKLTSIDVSKNIALTDLDCSSNELYVLDILNNKALTFLSCCSDKLSVLDVSSNSVLKELQCTYNSLTSLNLNNNTSLKRLDCHNNQLTSLDLSENINLIYVTCCCNSLANINLSNNSKLESLNCGYNKLSGTLDLSSCVNLTELYCYHNFYLNTLNISNSALLYRLECYCDTLTTLDLSNCPKLRFLWCSSNKLSSLDLSNNTALEELDCSENYDLTYLDVSKNVNLIKLNYNASVTDSLDLSNNTSIKKLNIKNIKNLTANFFGIISTVAVNGNGYLSVNTNTFPNCDIIAVPRSIGMSFENWTLNDSVISTNSSYTVSSAISSPLVANFSGNCNVTVISNNSTYGTVTGAGTYDYNSSATLKATPKAGYYFIGWLEGTSTVSTNSTYTFTVTKGRTLKAEFAKLQTPVLSSVKSAGYNSIKLKWGSVTGAKSYNIYRATSKSGTYSKIASTSSTSYKNTGLITGKTYYYKVKAVCVAGSTTTYSSYSSYKYAKPIPSTPSTTVKSSSYKSIKISWGKVSGASGYRVYRATSKSGTYKLIKTTTSTSYTNSSLRTGKRYYYKVRAYKYVSGSRVYGKYSSIKSAKPSLSKPSNFSVSRYSSSKIKISYGSVSGASGYRIYRATSRSGTYKLVKTTTSRSWINTGRTKGKTYYYKVRAYRWVSGKRVYGPYTTIKYTKT